MTKEGYKPELQTPETIKLSDRTKKLIDNTKNGKNVPSLEVVLVQCNLVDNQYQQRSQVLYIFMPTKSYGYLLTLICVGFLGVRFPVGERGGGRGGKITPCLKLIRIMLGT